MSNGIFGLQKPGQQRMRTLYLSDGTTQEIPEADYNNIVSGSTPDSLDLRQLINTQQPQDIDWLKTLQPFQRSGGLPGYILQQHNPLDTVERVGASYNPLDFLKALKEDPGYAKDVAKAPVRELLTTPLRSLKGFLNWVTPDKDTQLEDKLKDIIDRGILPGLEADPRYQGRTGTAISGALGQLGAFAGIAGLTALALPGAVVSLPVLGTVGLASLAMGAGMGFETQADRFHEYERRSGRDLPWMSELSAITAGGAIGLTEVMPLKIGRYGFNRKFWPVQRVLPGRLAPIGSALRGGLAEGTQEATAGVAQTLVAKAYDPQAFENWAKEAEQEFVVGGAAGAIASLVRAMLPGKHGSGGDRNSDASAEVELRRFERDHGYGLLNAEEYVQNVGQRLREEGVSEEVIAVWENIEENMQRPINKNLMLGLQSSYTDFKILEREYNRFQEYYKTLEQSVIADPSIEGEEQNQVIALIREEASKRMQGIEEIVGNAQRYNYDNGGLTTSEQYQDKKESRIAEIDNARSLNATEVDALPELSNSEWVYAVGSSGGLEGGFALEEILGIHGGRSSQGVDTSLDEERIEFIDEQVSIPVKIDKTKAASDNASFSPSQIARALALNIGVFRSQMKMTDATKELEVVAQSKEGLQKRHETLYTQNPVGGSDAETTSSNMENIFLGDNQLQEEGEALDNTDKRLHINFLNNQLKNASDILLNDEKLQQKVAKELGFATPEQLSFWLSGMTNSLAQHDIDASNTIDQINRLLEKTELVRKYSVDHDQEIDGGFANVKVSKIEKDILTRLMRDEKIAREEDIRPDQMRQIERQASQQEAQLQGSLSNKIFSSNIPAQDAKRIVDLLVASKPKRNTVFSEVLADRIDADVDLEERNRLATPPILATLNEETRELVDGVRKKIAKNPENAVTDKDIINLLRSKNYFLRGDGSLKDLEGDIKKVAYAGGTGVNSLPFRRLLRDLAAVDQWSKATPAQKALIYFSLARIPKVRVRRENYLMDMYEDPALDAHVDEIVSQMTALNRAADATPQKQDIFNVALPSLDKDISQLSDEVELALGSETFDKGVFGEAIARVLESKVLVADKNTVRLDTETGTEITADAYWASESKPEMIKDILRDKEHSQKVRIMTDEYNEKREKRNKNLKPVTTRQFLDMLAPYLADSFGMRQLDSMGLLSHGTRSILRRQPVAELMSESATAREVYKDLILKGAIPSTMNPGSQQLRQAVIEVTGKKLREIKNYIKDVVNSLDFQEDVKIRIVADADSEFSILSDVLIAGRDMGDAAVALREVGPITEIIYNVSSLDPRIDIKKLGPEIMRNIARPQIFDAIQRTVFNETELQEAGKLVANTTVPDFINAEAASKGLTWLEAKMIEMTNKDGVAPNLEDALMHAVSDYFAEMISNKDFAPVQKKIMSNAMDKIYTNTEGLFGGIARAVQEAEIGSIWQIYTNMSTGQLAQRARAERGLLSDEKELIPGLPVGAVRLMRYANNAEVEEYRTAIALRDSTTNEADQKMEQAKVDTISKRILSRRNMIQQSVPPPPDEIKKLSDEAEHHRMLSEGNRTVIPLVGKQLELDLGPINVWYGSGENASLSNLASRPFEIDGRKYVSVEHAYQTLKSGSFDADTYNKNWKEGVKIRGKRVDPANSIPLMKRLVLESFRQNPETQQALIDTGESTITHNQDKGIWGTEFPAILTEVRSELAEELGRSPDDQAEILSHTLDILEGRAEPYVMPSEYTRFFARQTIFDEQTIKLADAQNIEGQEPFDKVLEVIGESMGRGDSPADAVRIFRKDIEKQLEPKFNKKIIQAMFNANEPIARLNKEVAEALDMTAIPALSDTLWAKSVADNIGNYVKSLMNDGPVTFTGETAERGMFRVVPVRSDFLKKKYGMDRIPGLNAIFAIIDGAPKDQMVATLYGLGKSLQWQKRRHDYWLNREAVTPEQQIQKERDISRYRSDKRNINKITKKVDPDAVYKEGDKIPPKKKVGDRLSANDYEAKLDALILHTEKINSPVVKFWDVLNEFTNHSLRTAYNAELITKQRYDILTEMPYIPRYIAPEFLEDGQMDVTRVISDDLLSRSRKASESPIHDDLFANNAMNAMAVLRDSANNIWVNRAVRDEETLGRARDVTGKVSRSTAIANPDRYIRVKQRGIEKIYEVDDKAVVRAAMQIGFSPERLWNVIAGQGPEPVKDSWYWKMLRFPSDAVRQLVTRSIGFIERNLQRDGMLGMFFHGFSDGGVNFFMELLNNVADPTLITSGALIDKDKASDTVMFVRNHGGDFGFDYTEAKSTRDPLADSFEGSLMKEMAESKKPLSLASKALKASIDYMSPDRWGLKEVVNPLQWVPLAWHMMGTISSHVELSGRKAVFQMQLAKTGNRETAQRSAIEQINYGTAGGSPLVRLWAAVAPFINGALQGASVSWRTVFRGDTTNVPTTGHYGYTRTEWDALPFWKRDRAKIWARMMVHGTVASLLYLLNDDDEEFRRQSPIQRSQYMLIPIGDGTYMRYPMPHELGIVTTVIPQQITQAVLDKGHGWKDVTRESWAAIRKGFRYPLLPQVLSPVYDMLRNEDRYREQPIVDYYSDQLQPILQQGPGTDPMARGMAGIANQIPFLRETPLSSPDKVAYAISASIGPIGMFLKETAEKLAMEQHGISTIGTKYDKDDWQDNWGQNMWMSDKGIGGDQESVYGWLEKVGQIARNHNAMVESRQFTEEQAREYYDKHELEIDAYSGLQDIAQRLLELRTEEQSMRNLDILGEYEGVEGQKKRAEGKEDLRQERIRWFNEANKIIKELTEETGGRGPSFLP